ncbi:hypothetical protein [Sphaerisporangium perillae]|uniref:hypothetical protein n=1 Tax=Sphaerisporangium perillae TaxID=2935860 RepID=UPI00200BF54C|nr:hypothetical protein [Sphaerisporangium perillae]
MTVPAGVPAPDGVAVYDHPDLVPGSGHCFAGAAISPIIERSIGFLAGVLR